MHLRHAMPGYFLGETGALLVGCISLRETAAHCNTHLATRTGIRRQRDCCTLQHTPCNTHPTPRTEIHRRTDCNIHPQRHAHYTTHRNATTERLQHTATHAQDCNTLQLTPCNKHPTPHTPEYDDGERDNSLKGSLAHFSALAASHLLLSASCSSSCACSSCAAAPAKNSQNSALHSCSIVNSSSALNFENFYLGVSPCSCPWRSRQWSGSSRNCPFRRIWILPR